MSEETAQSNEDAAPEEVATPKKEVKPTKKVADTGFSDPVLLNGNIEIDPNKAVPRCNVGDEVKAYAARSVKGGGDYFALVCEPHLVPRVNSVESYQAFINPSLPPLAGKGTVFWPPAGAERYVLVYRDILGKPLKSIEGREAFGWKQDPVLEIVVKPLMNVLQDFRDKDFVHGSIRPSNMFDGGAGDQVQRVLLGDGLSVPCSYTQPALYEPIERAMASPIGRGKAIPADDLYALGVSIAVLMRSNDPMSGYSDEEVIQRKMEVGSYSAVTGKDRFKGSILELLRGLLIDDPAQRWTVEEVLLWLDGNRLSPKQAVRVKKAPRPLVFNEKKYLYMPTLAMDIAHNPPELVKLLETQDLEQWIGRAFEDDEAALRLEEAVKEASQGGKGGGYPDRLVATVSSALDTKAPLRYKGMRMTADAFGNSLAQTMILKQDIKAHVELLSSTLILNWITVSENPAVDKGALGGKMDGCRHYLRQNKVGSGIERCLYVLSPEVHCLSEKLKEYHVRSPEDMIDAFEDMCSKGKAPALFLDRHSAAFLSAKDSKCIDTFLFDLGSAEEHRRVLGNLKTLAVIQNRGKLGPKPALCKTFLDMLPCVYARYHDQSIRENLRKGIEKFAQSGDLVKMASLLDNVEVVNRDMDAFKGAMVEYRDLTKEAKHLEAKLQDRETFGKTTGKAIGAVISSVIAGIVIIVTTFSFISGQGIF